MVDAGAESVACHLDDSDIRYPEQAQCFKVQVWTIVEDGFVRCEYAYSAPGQQLYRKKLGWL